jgi:hypothetical protein
VAQVRCVTVCTVHIWDSLFQPNNSSQEAAVKLAASIDDDLPKETEDLISSV